MEQITIAAVGDIATGPLIDPPESAFSHVMGPLRSADLRFAQCESVYSQRGSFQEQSGSRYVRQDPGIAAAAYKSVPFDVVSIASNHIGDWGPEGAEDTAETFRALGIHAIGAGRTIAEARKPAIIDCKGVRIAFLGYVSVMLPQTWATESRAGGVPMRAHTYYEPHEFQPGAPPRVVTVPDARDLENLVQDVRAARQNADLVFVSLHWGVHYISRPCDYQPVVAHAAIDAGANAILGHHPHQPQGMELYKDCVILYSIGNFSLAPHHKRGDSYCLPEARSTHKEVYTMELDPGLVLDFNRHFNESGIAYFDLDRNGIKRVSYLPTYMNKARHPEVVRPDQPQFERSLTFLNWAGKFIEGGITRMKPVDDRYEIFSRDGA